MQLNRQAIRCSVFGTGVASKTRESELNIVSKLLFLVSNERLVSDCKRCSEIIEILSARVDDRVFSPQLFYRSPDV